jgi:hypothetical protein
LRVLSLLQDELVPFINYDELPCPVGRKASKKCKEKNGNDEKEEDPSKTKDNNEPASKRETSNSTSPTGEE